MRCTLDSVHAVQQSAAPRNIPTDACRQERVSIVLEMHAEKSIYAHLVRRCCPAMPLLGLALFRLLLLAVIRRWSPCRLARFLTQQLGGRSFSARLGRGTLGLCLCGVVLLERVEPRTHRGALCAVCESYLREWQRRSTHRMSRARHPQRRPRIQPQAQRVAHAPDSTAASRQSKLSPLRTSARLFDDTPCCRMGAAAEARATMSPPFSPPFSSRASSSCWQRTLRQVRSWKRLLPAPLASLPLSSDTMASLPRSALAPPAPCVCASAACTRQWTPPRRERRPRRKRPPPPSQSLRPPRGAGGGGGGGRAGLRRGGSVGEDPTNASPPHGSPWTRGALFSGDITHRTATVARRPDHS